MLDVSTGWRIDVEDFEGIGSDAIEFRAGVDDNFEAPESIDPRPWMQIENQGRMGSCVGHALTSVREFAENIESDRIVQLSRMHGYLGSQKHSGLLGRDQGATIRGALQFVESDGIGREIMFPYPNPVRYSTRIPDDAAVDGRNYRSKTHSECRSYDDCFQYLASGMGGVLLGIQWLQSMSANPITEYAGGGGGGHAVAFLGYTKRKTRDGRNFLLLFNSWGRRWGNNGVKEISPAAIDAMFRSRYTVMIGISDLLEPKPRSYKWTDSNAWGGTSYLDQLL